MIKLIMGFVFAIIFLIFASQNMKGININLLVGPPVKVPIIVLVFSSFMCGVVVSLFFTIIGRSRRGKKEV
ncbi:hypothetical protein LCGC14_2429800 [marine sediment metagenome]|uniref:Lipopolysaccharide assembly protein A domain-containing protein n=1 Tax=marine sediment metagenome TaxID=412755 RepID=A0A0F9C9J9_9ZZZZ